MGLCLAPSFNTSIQTCISNAKKITEIYIVTKEYEVLQAKSFHSNNKEIIYDVKPIYQLQSDTKNTTFGPKKKFGSK